MYLIIVLWWRFITGLHMDGKQRRLPQTSKVKPQFHNWYWNRISRPKRAAYRISAVLIIDGIAIGRIFDWWLTSFVLLAVSPFVALWVLRFALRKLTTVTTFHDSDGAVDRYRHLRPKYARKLRAIRERRFKLQPPSVDTIQAGTPEHMNALAEAAEDHLEPVKRIARPLDMSDMLTELASPEVKAKGSGRGRTIRRAVERRQR
jgi:hypothetical protein